MPFRIYPRLAALALCLALSLAGLQANAAPSPQAQKEIDHLLGFIQQSPCVFNRNGTTHPGNKAVKHIRDKLDYFSNDIQTAEDFIRLSATQSELTRKAYSVQCPEQATEPSKDWLLRELKRYRASGSQISGNR